MGMYDYIDYEMDCPICKHKIDSFQSKDGGCSGSTLKYWEVDYFYSSCDNCGAWISFYRKHRPFVPIEEYKMTADKRVK